MHQGDNEDTPAAHRRCVTFLFGSDVHIDSLLQECPMLLKRTTNTKAISSRKGPSCSEIFGASIETPIDSKTRRCFAQNDSISPENPPSGGAGQREKSAISKFLLCLEIYKLYAIPFAVIYSAGAAGSVRDRFWQRPRSSLHARA